MTNRPTAADFPESVVTVCDSMQYVSAKSSSPVEFFAWDMIRFPSDSGSLANPNTARATSPNAEDPLTPATTSPLAALFRCTTPKTVPLCQYYAPVGAWFCNGQYIVAVIDELRFHVFLYLRMWRACASSSVPICSAVSALIGTVTDLPLAGLRRMPTSPRRVSSRKSIESGSMVIVSFGSCFVGRQLVGRSLRLKA